MKRFDNIVFFDYAPLTEKIYNDFYFDDILKLGVNVQYWDVSFIIQHRSKLSPFHKDESSVVIHSRTEFKQRVKAIKERTLFVPIMTYNGMVLSLFLILSFNKCKIAVFGINTIPVPPFSPKSVLKVSKFSLGLFYRAILNKLSVALKKLGVIRGVDYIFASGENGLGGFGRTTNKELNNAKIIRINSVDYDKCLSIGKELKNPLDGEYIVFLDEYLPFHPDMEISGLKVIDSDYYYTHLNNFFDSIEKEFGIPVVIAAHPKAEKYKQYNYFNGRSVLFYKAAELCKYAKLVLAHDSTAMNFAVFFNKPILILLFNKMKQDNNFTYVSSLAFADALNAPTVIVDNDYKSLIKMPVVDNMSFDAYLYRYMTSPETRSIQSKQVVLEFLGTTC